MGGVKLTRFRYKPNRRLKEKGKHGRSDKPIVLVESPERLEKPEIQPNCNRLHENAFKPQSGGEKPEREDCMSYGDYEFKKARARQRYREDSEFRERSKGRAKANRKYERKFFV